MINVMRKLNIGSMKANKKLSNIKEVVKKRSLEKVIPKGHFIRIGNEFRRRITESRFAALNDFFFKLVLPLLNTGSSSEIEKIIIGLSIFFFQGNHKYGFLPANLSVKHSVIKIISIM